MGLSLTIVGADVTLTEAFAHPLDDFSGAWILVSLLQGPEHEAVAIGSYSLSHFGDVLLGDLIATPGLRGSLNSHVYLAREDFFISRIRLKWVEFETVIWILRGIFEGIRTSIVGH